jgi:CPW-WPC domain-containing protein
VSIIPPPDNSLVFRALAAAGITKAESQLDTDKQGQLVKQVVSTIAHARLDTHFYSGMCYRNYSSPCPAGWTLQPDACSNPSQDASLPQECASFPIDGSNIKKSEFAVKCRAQWPCGACTRDFSDCPNDFIQVEEGRKALCEPATMYGGPCPERIDFRKITDTKEKARWASRCLTSWPCFPE